MTRGPIPKRTEQRRRRNQDAPVDRAAAGPRVSPPPLREGLCDLAVEWYGSLAQSGQSQFYELSDWLMAQVIAEAIDEFASKPSGPLLSQILSGSSVLLATEGDRRRLRLELVRDEPEVVEKPHPVRRLKAVDAG